MVGGRRTAAVLAGAGIAVLLSGCVSTVTGTATRPPGPAALQESDLDGVLLPIDELNSTVGATDMTVNSESSEMSDHSEEVSDQDCLGAIFSPEESVYAGSKWTAVRDQVAAEPADDNEHWVQQSAVLFDEVGQAANFVRESRTTWEGCAGEVIAVGDDITTYLWELRDVAESGGIMTQTSGQEDSGGWSCQHAMADVANVVVETWACGYTVDDQAAAVAAALIDNVEGG